MAEKTAQLARLGELSHGEEAELFLLMTSKEQLTTRDGKPYFKVGFRDATQEVSFPIWNDSAWSAECRAGWNPGEFYKLRAVYRETNYGAQLDIHKIRPVTDRDRAEGFDPQMCLPRSRFNPEEMFRELMSIARETLQDRALSQLVVDILQNHRTELLTLPSATRNHHAYVGGFLEHVLSVTRTCIFLANKYDDYYPELDPPLNKDVVVAGAILHDIGKLRELEQRPQGAVYTPEGHLIGHVLQGRDIVRETAAGRDLKAETLLRLEHVIVSHQRLPEWGAPKPPMTPEAIIVHYADDLDAKFHMMAQALKDATAEGPMITARNVLQHVVYRGDKAASRSKPKPR